MGIKVTKRTDDWHACLTGDNAIWGCGKSVATAIGALILAHEKSFDLTIVIEENLSVTKSLPTG